MKRLPFFLLPFLLLYGSLLHCESIESKVKTILVTYKDRILTRAPIATLSGSYRPSHAYTSSTWSRNLAKKLAEQYQLKIQFAWPIDTIGVQCVVYEISDHRSVADVLKSMGDNKRIESVQSMVTYDVYSNNASASFAHAPSPLGRPASSFADIHRWTTGKGILIALIDTGVDINHPDLQGQILSTHNLIDHFSESFADDLHGTAVAGVISARADNNLGAIGIAPGAKLVALKACWPQQAGQFQASCNSLSLVMAINRAISLNVDIINLSLSGEPDPLVSRMINEAIARGIVVVAADHDTHQARQQSFPASMNAVIAARHLLPTLKTRRPMNHHSVAVQSSNILTTLPQGKYKRVSSCSIAAAQVSGIVALLLEVNYDLTPNQIQTLLETAEKYHDTPVTDEINVHALIAKLRDNHVPVKFMPNLMDNSKLR